MNRIEDKPTVMIVDDTPANLDLLDQMLRRYDCRVQVFPRGHLALESAAENQPDLILLDVMMPEMDGFELCRRLKSDDRLAAIPVIFISALNDIADKLRAFSAGAVDYVTKPFQEDEVLARVGTHLEIVMLQRRLREQNEYLEYLVRERTRDLTLAHERLLDMARLKDKFLAMISHELRTPANGVLGVGELLIQAYPPTDEIRMLSELFRESGARLRSLFDDVSLISSIAEMNADSKRNLPFEKIMDDVRQSLPHIFIDIELVGTAPSLFPDEDRPLLHKALSTLVTLASCFSADNRSVRLGIRKEARLLSLDIDLDAISIPQGQADTFFDIESPVRSASKAEELGLGPVVAHQIITSRGGSLKMVKNGGNSGRLLLTLPVTD